MSSHTYERINVPIPNSSNRQTIHKFAILLTITICLLFTKALSFQKEPIPTKCSFFLQISHEN